MVRARLILLCGVMAIASACSQKPGADQSITPQGWKRSQIPGCCTIAVPPGMRLAALPDPIDDASYELHGNGFLALLTVTAMGSGLPPPGTGKQYTQSKVTIDGIVSPIAAYTLEDGSALPQRRYVVWPFRGKNDGRGANLVVAIQCKGEACSAIEPLVHSLKRN